MRDLVAGTTSRVSVSTSGGQLAGTSYDPGLSPDGGAVSFTSDVVDLHPGDHNSTADVFWRGTHELGPFATTKALLQRNAVDLTGAPLPIATVIAIEQRVRTGSASPSSAIDDLAHGAFDDHRGPVMRLYWSFFHRIPDPGGLSYWVGRHEAGTKLAAIAAQFAASSEFRNTYGPLGHPGFVALVYQNVLGRAPDAVGLAHWVAALEHGSSRGDIMTAFSESSEGRRLMRAEVDTFLVTLGMFGRLPTPAELQSAVTLLEGSGGQPTEALVERNLALASYAARVGT